MKAQSALEYFLANQDWLLGLQALAFDLAVEIFSRLFNLAFGGFCCTVLLISRLKVDPGRNMGSKHNHDKKRRLRKVSKARMSSNKTKWSQHALFAA